MGDIEGVSHAQQTLMYQTCPAANSYDGDKDLWLGDRTEQGWLQPLEAYLAMAACSSLGNHLTCYVQ